MMIKVNLLQSEMIDEQKQRFVFRDNKLKILNFQKLFSEHKAYPRNDTRKINYVIS